MLTERAQELDGQLVRTRATCCRMRSWRASTNLCCCGTPNASLALEGQPDHLLSVTLRKDELISYRAKPIQVSGDVEDRSLPGFGRLHLVHLRTERSRRRGHPAEVSSGAAAAEKQLAPAAVRVPSDKAGEHGSTSVESESWPRVHVQDSIPRHLLPIRYCNEDRRSSRETARDELHQR